MKRILIACCLSGLIVGGTGCGKKTPAVVEVAVDPNAVSQAFSNAPPEAQQEASQALDSLHSGDAVASFEQLQRLESKAGLTPQQMREAGRAKAAALQQMQKAAAAGDQKSQQAMDRYRSSR
jgi:hypothetical protein